MTPDILFRCLCCQGKFYKKARAHKYSPECTPTLHVDFCDTCGGERGLIMQSFRRQMSPVKKLRLEESPKGSSS